MCTDCANRMQYSFDVLYWSIEEKLLGVGVKVCMSMVSRVTGENRWLSLDTTTILHSMEAIQALISSFTR